MREREKERGERGEGEEALFSSSTAAAVFFFFCNPCTALKSMTLFGFCQPPARRSRQTSALETKTAKRTGPSFEKLQKEDKP